MDDDARRRRLHAAAWIAPMLLGALLRIPRGDGAPIAWDEAWYALAGQTYANLPRALSSRAEGETVAQAMERLCPWGAIPRLEYKPAYVTVVALASLPVRDRSLLPGRLVSAICGILAIGAAACLARGLGFGPTACLAAGLWMAVSPMMVHVSRHAMPTAMGTLWWLLAAHLAAAPSTNRLILASAWIGLGPCIHPSLGLSAAAFGLVLLVRRKAERALLLVGILAPFLFFEAVTEMQTFLLHRAGFPESRPLWREWFRRAPGIAEPGMHLPGDPLFLPRLGLLSEGIAATASAWAGLALLALRGGPAGRTLLLGAAPALLWSVLPHNLVRVHAPYWGGLGLGLAFAVETLARRTSRAARAAAGVLCLLPLLTAPRAIDLTRLRPLGLQLGERLAGRSPDGATSLYLGPPLRLLTGSRMHGEEIDPTGPYGAPHPLLVLAEPFHRGADCARIARDLGYPDEIAAWEIEEARDPFFWIETNARPAEAESLARGSYLLRLFTR